MTDHPHQPDHPTPEPAASPSATRGVVVGDTLLTEGLRCAQCRYALEGLRLEGRCPECGLDIPESIVWWDRRRLRPLIRGGRAYVNTIFAGSLLLLIGSGMCLLAGIALATLYEIGQYIGLSFAYPSPPGIALIVAGLAVVAACFLLTVREPGAPEHRRITFARWMIRGASLACAVVLWPGALAWMAKTDLGSPFDNEFLALYQMTLVALLTTLFAYISWLAARVEAGALESWSKSLAVCLLIAFVIENAIIGGVYDWGWIISAMLPVSIACVGLVFVSAALVFRVHGERRPGQRPVPFSVRRPGG